MRMVILAAGLGQRLRQETGGRAKILLDLGGGGGSILDRAIALAAALGLSPLVVTRREHADEIGRYAEVRVENDSQDIMDTLYLSRGLLTETFCWIGGDTVFSDPAPVQELLALHRQEGSAGSIFYCRTDRFKSKLELSPSPRFTVTREGSHALSSPNFMIQNPELLDDMTPSPRNRFVQRAIDRGARILFREYAPPVFEIDTPEDLATARRFFQREP